MRENLKDAVDAAIKWLAIVAIFATPLIFSPFNFDFFEFPKQVFIWSVAAILLVLWLAKSVIDNELSLIKTPFDLPLLLFIGITVISAVLTQGKYTAIVGFFGRPDGGLAALVAYAVIFYVAGSRFRNLTDILHALSAFVISAALLSLLGLLSYFGVKYAPLGSIDPRMFSPAGGMYVLVGLLPLAVPVALGLLMYLRKQASSPNTQARTSMEDEMTEKPTIANVIPFLSIVVTVAIMLMLAVIIAVGTTYSMLGTIVGIVVLFLWSKRGSMKAVLPYVLGLCAVSLYWVAMTKVPFIRQHVPLINQTMQPQQVLDARQSWIVTSNTIREYPFFGTGPASFLYDFTRFRSIQFNTTDAWNLRFVVPHDQYLLTLATTGILGLLAYLFLIFRVGIYGFKTALANRDSDSYPLKVGVFAAIAGFLVLTALTPTTTSIFFSFFALLAMFVALEHVSGAKDVGMRRVSFGMVIPGTSMASKPSSVVPLALLVAGLGIAGGVFFYTAQYVRANAYYVTGASAFATGQPQKIDQALKLEEKATITNKYEDSYHRDLAKSAIAVAIAISQKKDITDDDKRVVTNLLQLSEGHAREAARLAPLNVNNWQALADIYRQVAPQIKGAGDLALQAFNQAIQTDPANAQLFLDVGGIFYAANAYDASIDAFKRAADLKPNLPNAYYNLANAYLKKGEYDNANAAYARAKAIISSLPNNDATKKDSLAKLDTEIAAIADKVTQASASGTVAGESTNAPAPSGTPLPSASVKASATPLLKSSSPAASPR